MNNKLTVVKNYVVTPTQGYSAPSIQEKNGVFYIRYAITFGPAAEWSETKVAKILGWPNIALSYACPLHSLYGVQSETAFVHISASGDVSIVTHAAITCGKWFFGTSTYLLK